MKRILIYALIAIGSAVLSFKACEKIDNYLLTQRVERMNKHIQYLHDEEGYSWEAARKIGATEAQFIPMDDEYNSLKED